MNETQVKPIRSPLENCSRKIRKIFGGRTRLRLAIHNRVDYSR